MLDESESIREIVHVADTVWMCLSKSTKIVVVASQTKRVLRVISLKVSLFVYRKFCLFVSLKVYLCVSLKFCRFVSLKVCELVRLYTIV